MGAVLAGGPAGSSLSHPSREPFQTMSSKTPASSSTADRIHAIHLDGLSRKDVSKTPSTSLHSSMYYSPEVYDLERRAIFSKRWILISHQARYREPGDFVQYEMAGFNVVVVIIFAVIAPSPSCKYPPAEPGSSRANIMDGRTISTES
jgi:hypothetical protein